MGREFHAHLRHSQTFATGSAPQSITVADINGDGKLDIVVTNPKHDDISVLLNALYMDVAFGSPATGTSHYGDQLS